jgi:gas vesicle structural protein
MANVVKSSLDSPNLAEMINRILDKGIVIDAWVKIAIIGIDLIAVEARVVIASIDTYLRYAEAIGLIEPLKPTPEPTPIPEPTAA